MNMERQSEGATPICLLPPSLPPAWVRSSLLREPLGLGEQSYHAKGQLLLAHTRCIGAEIIIVCMKL